MTLKEIFQALTYGELSQVHIGGAEGQGITPANQNQILTHVNLGLTELHKRFLLKEGKAVLARPEGMNTFVLNKKYAVSNRESWEPNKYILDSTESPFLNDVLKIERVYNDKGEELMLNAGEDLANPYHVNVRTPNYNTIVVPDSLKSETLSVVYRANHPQIIREDNSFDPEEIEVDLPFSHLEPLLYYVAMRVLNPVGLSGEFHDGNNYAMKFEQACALLEQQNYRVDVGEQNHRLIRNGWV